MILETKEVIHNLPPAGTCRAPGLRRRNLLRRRNSNLGQLRLPHF